MFTRLLSSVVAAGFLLAAAPIVAHAADAPKTKSECAKHKDMKWDVATKTCVKK